MAVVAALLLCGATAEATHGDRFGVADRIQALTWNARGRLAKVEQRDGSKDGFDFECVYDGLGRRIRTGERSVVDDAPDANSTVVTDSVFDPEVEFMEIAVWCGWEHRGGATRLVDPENEGWTWKVYGTDLNGAFGGLQGIGGLEAIIGPTTTVWPIHDLFGNVVGHVPGPGNVTWSPMAYTAFGPRTDKIVPSLLPGMPLHEVLNYRGKRLDPTGDYWWGARYYDPIQGQFTSHDPMGYADGANPYAFCLNNPLVWQDADGRLSADAWKGFNQGIDAASIQGRGFDYYGFEHSYWARSVGGMIGYNLGLLNNVAKIPFQAAADINTLGQQTFGSDWDAFTLYTGVHFFEAQQAAAVAPLVFDQMSARIQAAIVSPEIRFGGVELNPSQAGRLDLSFLGRTFGNPGRSIPGIAAGSDGLADVTGVWLRGSSGNAGRMPGQIARQLEGQAFASFDEFRSAFWQSVSGDSTLAPQFSAPNLARMRQGMAPIAPTSQQVGGMRSFILHHQTPIYQSGGVYDMSNIQIVSPRYHQEILDPILHYGR